MTIFWIESVPSCSSDRICFFKSSKAVVLDFLIEEFLDCKEYTIDLFSDFNNNVISIVPRERITVIAGDYIGLYCPDGRLDRATSGGEGFYHKSGDGFGGVQTYTLFAGQDIALKGNATTT